MDRAGTVHAVPHLKIGPGLGFREAQRLKILDSLADAAFMRADASPAAQRRASVRQIYMGALACWLVAVGLLGCLQLAGYSARGADVASAYLLGPMLSGSRLLYIHNPTWVTEWLLNAALALTCASLVFAFALRQSRVTALLTLAGLALWFFVGYMTHTPF